MTASSPFVAEAQTWARALVRTECRFPGDYSAAMRRLAHRLKVSHGLLWALHHRAPKTIGVEQYARLAGAVANARDQYRSERCAVEAKTALGAALLGLADRLCDAADGSAD